MSLPSGWHGVIERGQYGSCANPIIRLDLASYRLPVGFGKHEGAIVVPADGILLSIVSAPVRSRARPWRQWRLSDHELQSAHGAGPNRYAADVDLPSSVAAGATAWLGSNPILPAVLGAANRILASARPNQNVSCR